MYGESTVDLAACPPFPATNCCDVSQAVGAGGRTNEGQRFVSPSQMPLPSVTSDLSGLLSRRPELRTDRTSFDELQGTAVTQPSAMMPQSSTGRNRSLDDGLQVRTSFARPISHWLVLFVMSQQLFTIIGL